MQQRRSQDVNFVSDPASDHISSQVNQLYPGRELGEQD